MSEPDDSHRKRRELRGEFTRKTPTFEETVRNVIQMACWKHTGLHLFRSEAETVEEYLTRRLFEIYVGYEGQVSKGGKPKDHSVSEIIKVCEQLIKEITDYRTELTDREPTPSVPLRKEASESTVEDISQSKIEFRLPDQKTSDILEHADEAAASIHAVIIRQVENALKPLTGRSHESLEENKAVADRINRLLRRFALRLACQKEGCGAPSILRCYLNGSLIHGAFAFEHDGGKVRHLASPTIPKLEIIPLAEPAKKIS